MLSPVFSIYCTVIMHTRIEICRLIVGYLHSITDIRKDSRPTAHTITFKKINSLPNQKGRLSVIEIKVTIVAPLILVRFESVIIKAGLLAYVHRAPFLPITKFCNSGL